MLPQLILATIVLASVAIEAASFNRTQFAKEVLVAHNKLRAVHNVSDVTLNSNISKQAKTWAKYLAVNNLFEHSQLQISGYMGENIAAWVDEKPQSAAFVTGLWYNEVHYAYDYTHPDIMNAGYFTQMVWKSTKEIGVGYWDIIQSDGRLRRTTVVNYRPPGNIVGLYPENVLEPENPLNSEQVFTLLGVQ